MLNMCILTAVMVFSVIGIYFTVKELAALFLKNFLPCCVVMEVTDKSCDIEGAARLALAANPKSELVLVDKCTKSEIKDIMLRLCRENDRVSNRAR